MLLENRIVGTDVSDNYNSMNEKGKNYSGTVGYLTYGPAVQEAGMKHQWNNIKAVCREAVACGRCVVADLKVHIPTLHNSHGKSVAGWDRYWDLSSIRACTFLNRQVRSVPLNIIWEKNIEEWLSNNNQHSLQSYEIIGDCHSEKKFLHRQIAEPSWSNNRIPLTADQLLSLNKQLGAVGQENDIIIEARPSDAVRSAVKDIIQAIGSDYWGIHIRRNDFLYRYAGAEKVSSSTWIIANLISAGLTKHTPLFVMTDEKDPAYLSSLRKQFRVVTFWDFPSGHDLAEKYPGDDFIVYHTERQIWMQAHRLYKCPYEAFDYNRFFHSLDDDVQLQHVQYQKIPAYSPFMRNDGGPFYSELMYSPDTVRYKAVLIILSYTLYWLGLSSFTSRIYARINRSVAVLGEFKRYLLSVYNSIREKKNN